MPETIEDLKKHVSVLEQRLSLFENHGAVRLYYALNKKMNEMADMLNSKELKNIPIDDPKDKTFERIRFIINDSSGIITTLKTLGEIVGITTDEENDKKRKVPFLETIADKRV